MMDQQSRNVATLALAQALFVTSTSLLISTSALVGLALAPHATLSTVPLGLQFLVTMSATMPASLLMKRLGRRAGLRLGAVAGMLGGSVATYAILNPSFVLFCLGCALIGIFNCFAAYFRFAAADAASDAFRSRAISLTLSGGVIAAFLGPNLASWSSDWWAPHVFSGGYACLVALYAACFLILGLVEIPNPKATRHVGSGRPLAEIARQPGFVVAAFCATVAYGAMNLVMTATPLAMRGCGFAFDDTATVIQWHVVGMFAPSFATGSLIARFGVLNVMIVGAALLLLCVLVNSTGVEWGHFWVALVLLGVGWNFLFVGATTLLTECYRDDEKAKTQGLNELSVFSMVALTAMTSGALHAELGWVRVNWCVVPLVLGALVMTYWLKRKSARLLARAA